MGYIISMSGTHGTGKSTAALKECSNIKYLNNDKSVKILIDLERDCPYPINKDATELTQEWLFSNQLHQELSCLGRYDIVVTDRTIVDVIGYTAALGFHGLAMDMTSYASHHMMMYKKIYLKRLIYNDFCHDDGVRETTDTVFRQAVESEIIETYEHLTTAGHIPGKVYHV